MRILFVADIHVNQDHLDHIIEAAIASDADALIIGGDIVPHYLPNAHAMGILDAQAMYLEGALIPALKRLKASKAISIYLDFGNDDFMANRPLLEPYENNLFQLLHMQKCAISDEVDLIGYMMVPPTPFQRKDWEKPDAKDAPYPSSGRVRLKGYTTRSGQIEEMSLDLDDDRTIENILFMCVAVKGMHKGPPYMDIREEIRRNALSVKLAGTDIGIAVRIDFLTE